MQSAVLILGSGDLGTACALRLFRAGFGVVLAGRQRPLDIHFHRTFSGAAYAGFKTVENVTARTYAHALEGGMIEDGQSVLDYMEFQLNNREIAYLIPDDFPYIKKIEWDFFVVTDSALSENILPFLAEQTTIVTFTRLQEAVAAHYRIISEGRYTGRVFYPFLQDIYDNQSEKKEQRSYFVHAPLDGLFIAEKTAGAYVHEKDVLGSIAGIPILAPQNGRVTGILNSGIMIERGTVFAEIDPAGREEDSRVIPAYCFNLAGGVLEAIMYHRKLEED